MEIQGHRYLKYDLPHNKRKGNESYFVYYILQVGPNETRIVGQTREHKLDLMILSNALIAAMISDGRLVFHDKGHFQKAI